MGNTLNANRLSFALFPVVVILIAGASLYFLYPSDDEQAIKNLKFEVTKYLIQLIIVVVIGGILVHEYNRGRNRAKAVNEFRKILLDNLIRAYFQTKKVRRILDASVRTNPKTKKNEILCSVYTEQMKLLNETQLQFEFYKYQLSIFPYVFQNFTDLKNKAKFMEGYLNDIVDEYQNFKGSSDTSESIEVSKLEKLESFLKTKAFTSDFSSVFVSTLKLMQMEIPGI